MGKRYDWQVTPQNTPRLSERRALFLVAMGTLVLNLVLIGIFLASNMTWFLLCAVFCVAFSMVQYFDSRREMWTWGYVISWIVLSFAASAILILWYKAYWWFVGYGIELSLFVLISIRLLKRKNRRQKQAKIYFCVDLLLSFFVIIVPMIAITLYSFGVQIPKMALGIYGSVAFIIAGVLFITFTTLEKFGFGKAGTYFNKLTGWKELTKEEAKANTGVFGGVMIAIGIFFAVLTAIYC